MNETLTTSIDLQVKSGADLIRFIKENDYEFTQEELTVGILELGCGDTDFLPNETSMIDSSWRALAKENGFSTQESDEGLTDFGFVVAGGVFNAPKPNIIRQESQRKH